MANIRYDKEEVLRIIAEYFIKKMSPEEMELPIEQVYGKIVQYAAAEHKEVKMPKYLQARKMLISKLKAEGRYTEGERLTAAAAYRLHKGYYSIANLEEVIQNEYRVTYVTKEPIVCIIPLSPAEITDMLTDGIRSAKNKPAVRSRLNMIRGLCVRIRKRDPKQILAVIPECNMAVYLTENGRVRADAADIEPRCSALCVFIRNTPEGRALAERMKKQPDSVFEFEQ